MLTGLLNIVRKARESIRETRESLVTEPEKLKLDDNDIVATKYGERITWSESKRRVNPSHGKTEFQKQEDRIAKYQSKIDRTKYPGFKIDTSNWPKWLMVN